MLSKFADPHTKGVGSGGGDEAITLSFYALLD